ncbi:MAG: type II secretion system F family protein [Candidatus Nanopelagicales bacterium]
MSPLLLAALAGVAVLLAMPAPAGAHVRRARPGTSSRRRRPRLGPWSAALLAGAGAAVLVPGPPGLLLAVAVALGVRLVVPRLEGEHDRRRRDRLARQAPVTVDLVAACLASGAPPDRAVEAAARAVGAPTSEVLLPAVAALRLGADPEQVWREVAAVDGLAALARAFARSQRSGAALADLLPRVADEVRSAARARAEGRIRTAAVRLTAPLGAALLPAFVLLGVVPVVASWVGVLL